MTRSSDLVAVLVSAVRTPVGKFGGALAAVDVLDLGASAVAGAVDAAAGVIPDHVYLGNVIQAGNGQNAARSVAVRAGLPMSVPATTLNDVCLASMSATGIAASLVRAGEIGSAVVGGFDSMSRAMHGVRVRQAKKLGDLTMIDLLSKDGLWCAIADEGMGPISERANAEYGIHRQEQDDFALQSHRRAAMATTSGRLIEEIVSTSGVDRDEGVRYDASAEGLAALRPAFAGNGTITAGNASQMSDAAAAGVVMSSQLATQLGARPLVEIVGRAVVAGPDVSLHTKPAVAARKLLDLHDLVSGDIDLWEINEAFAGVVIASMRELGINDDVVNVNGGAIAIGHPLAASGFRIIGSLAREMVARDAEHGIATMCGGGGQGEAILLRLPREN